MAGGDYGNCRKAQHGGPHVGGRWILGFPSFIGAAKNVKKKWSPASTVHLLLPAAEGTLLAVLVLVAADESGSSSTVQYHALPCSARSGGGRLRPHTSSRGAEEGPTEQRGACFSSFCAASTACVRAASGHECSCH